MARAYDLLPLSEVDAAYIAGLFDGEGTITVAIIKPKQALKTGNRYTPAASLTMCNEAVIRWLQSVTGIGSVYERRPQQARFSVSWTWALPARQAIPVLVRIHPYMRVKAEQARLYLEMMEIRKDSRNYGCNNPERQLQIACEIQALNRRGPDGPVLVSV